MLIDSKGKLFGKVSIVDILIVLMVLGVVAGVGYKFTQSRTSTPFAKRDLIKVTIYQEEVGGFVPGSIKVGDMVSDNQTGSILGKVVSVKEDKSNSFASTSDGIWVMSPKQTYASVTLEVEGEGIYKDGASAQGVSFGNIDFFINKSVEIKAGNAIFWAKIKNLEKKG